MSSISNVCSLNMSATITRTARILGQGREDRTGEATVKALVTFPLRSGWEGCIIVTIVLPETTTEPPNCTAKFYPLPMGWTRSYAAITEELRIGSGNAVLFAGRISNVRDAVHVIFGANEILASDRCPAFPKSAVMC